MRGRHPLIITAVPRRGIALLAVLACILSTPAPALASWPADPTVNVPVCTQDYDQEFPAILPDGGGGAFVVWQDYRDGVEYKIYAQRLSASGNPQWGANGIPICTSSGDQLVPHITTDGAGGAIVTWNDARAVLTDIYAQRISPGGDLLWAAGGVLLCGAPGPQHDEALIPDGAGGAIVTWWDRRDDAAHVIGDIYAQRVSAGGVVEWTPDGVPICVAAESQQYPMIAPDGAEGAIITWTDARNGSANRDIYAQRIAGDGTVVWANDGVALCGAANDQTSTVIVSDASGGAIVAWEDSRAGSGDKIYAQRVSPVGTIQWAPNGVTLSNGASYEFLPAILADGSGGAIVTWSDYRNAPAGGADIYAQRLSTTGAVQWGASGVLACGFSGDQLYPTITTDGAGGAIVAWQDHRNGFSNSDVYARRITAAGSVQWSPATGGVAVSTASATQYLPAIAKDGSGGAIIAWQDTRESTVDIYAQGVHSDGQLGGTVSVPGEAPRSLALEPVRPNPARGERMSVRFSLPSGGSGSLELLDVTGRRVAALDLGALGAGPRTVDLAAGRHIAAGVYLVQLRQGANRRVTRVAVLN